MMRVVPKSVLDQRVALLLGEKTKDVAAITEAFLAVTRGALVEENIVRLDGLGQLRVYAQAGAVAHLKPIHSDPLTATSKKKYRVSFKKASPLARALREKYGGAKVEAQMEKYGVDEQQAENEKRASDGCPECGRKAERHGNVLACPVHGTEPFESKSK